MGLEGEVEMLDEVLDEDGGEAFVLDIEFGRDLR